ncbi:alpha/beta fold hydrolase [Labrys sp. KB_33_2]|uniref:alpha/beta fold hydrolase n=1 Tax=unclassified Labrys (in: a-proteobacteria) TaxID=2688601 RepID=UPI003EBE56B7
MTQISAPTAPLPGVRNRSVELPNGLRHHFVEVGSDGPPLVLLHGYTDSWRSFEPLFARLGQQFRLLVLDQRGHGGSDAAEQYAIADFAGDAIDFIEAVVGGPVHLAGHSLGSIVAQRVAARRTDLVHSLVLIGAAPDAAGHAGLLELRTELAGLSSTIPRDFIEAFQKGTTFAQLSDPQLAIFVEESLKLAPETWRKVLDGLVDERAPPRQTLNLPALALWGAQDSVFDEGTQIRLARHIPDLTAIHYPAIGHAPHWESPARAAQDIANFLAAVEEETVAAKKDDRHHA